MMKPECIIVTTIESLPRTTTECPNCEEANLVRDGYEVICPHCFYTPGGRTRTPSKSEREQYRERVQAHADGKLDGRPRLAGGFPEAYWGEDEYEYQPSEGFHL